MNKIKRLFTLILISVFTTTCFACSKSGSAVDFSFFNTAIHIETHDFSISKQTEGKLCELFTSLDSQFSCNDSQSFVYKINNASANVPISLTEQQTEILSLAKEYHSFTDKKFSPAIFPLIKLWQFDQYPIANFTPPSQNEISALLGEKTSFDNVEIDFENKTVQKLNNDIMLDFGGMLKGYAVDKACKILLNDGHESGYISIGGSSLCLLSVENLKINHPRASSELYTLLDVNCADLFNVAISTSGDYEKFYTIDGVNYSHIINPLTGYPTNTGVVSATIIGSNGAFGDAVTTAMCLMEHQSGSKNSELVSFVNKILTEYPDSLIFAVYYKEGEKEIITNAKQGERFTLLDNSFSINKI